MNGNLQRVVEGVFTTIKEREAADKERAKRTLLIINLMDQVLDFNIGKPNITACRQFDLLPLTSSKRMWEAETPALWEIEYKRYLSNRQGMEMLRFGDLRKLSHLDAKELDRNLMLDLSNWASDVDGLGTMVISMCH